MKELKVIVAGGRDFNDYAKLSTALFDHAESVGENTGISIVSGMARGADSLAVDFARKENVMLYHFPANWDHYGKRAGFVRNAEMSEFADELIVFWDGTSRGTWNMIQTMERLNKPVHLHMY